MSDQGSAAPPLRIGVVGLGRIGLPVARNLASAGFDVFVLDKRPEATRGFGENVCASIGELVRASEAIIIAVPGPEEDIEILQGPGGVFREARAGLLVVDFTTLPVGASQSFAAAALAAGIDYLEAPVSGSEQGAVDGALTIMVAGEEQAFARARTILDVLGTKVVHVGAAGSAMLLKLINQTVYISYMMAFSEGVAAGEEAGIDLEVILDVLGTSAAGDPRIERKFPQMRGDTSQCFSAANAKRYFDFASAGMTLKAIGRATRHRLTQAVAAGAGASDVTALRRQAGDEGI
jgi:2-hydroxy-3-oxopropionate reductase